MKFSEYMTIRNTSPRNKNSLSSGEAKALGVDMSVRGWMKRDFEVPDEQLEQAVDAALKSRFVRQGVKNNLRPLYMNKLQGMSDKCVYLMENELGMLKIGISNDPLKRARALSTGSGLSVKLICYWQVSNRARTTEAYLHRVFKNFKISGEWFKPKSFDPIRIESHFNFNFIRKDFINT